MMTVVCAALEHQSDQDFMRTLYRDFERLMFSVARRYVSDWQGQEDVVQDAVVGLIQKIDLLRTLERCVLAGYIVSTVRNTAINHLKRQGRARRHISSQGRARRHISSQGLEEAGAPEEEAPSLDDLLVLAEQRSSLAGLWKRVPEEDRTLLEGKYILGYTDQELADQLGCKADSVRMKLTRARRRALKQLSDKEGSI